MSTYIPSARDAVVARFGRSEAGCLRCFCVYCLDAGHTLTDVHDVYGDLYVPTGPDGRADDDQTCDVCSLSLLTISQAFQRDHDAQQAAWARQPVTHVVEMGMVGAVRCRIY